MDEKTIKTEIMKIFKNLKAKYAEKEKQSDIINRRESIMHHLLGGLTTEESLAMFNEISVLFVSAAEKRLKAVNEEKSSLENFLSNEINNL